MDLEELLDLVRDYNPDADTGLLERAYRFSRRAHEGQRRASGEEYIEHPLAVAVILAGIGLDVQSLAAALLHDVVEDTDVTLSRVEAEFGDEVTLLVDGVTKLGRLESRTREEEQAENLRKMFLAMAVDIRVILIKLADRLHNLRTLGHLSPDRRRAVAAETLEVFAPLAHRLGIYRLRWELEDRALSYLEPERYSELTELVAKGRAERQAYIDRVIDTLRQRLDAAGIKGEIKGRPKNFYSIYRKIYEQGREFSEIYDLIAVRIIVETVKDCYGVLGTVHSIWPPIPARVKDFIAVPKSNMYQSLHTAVVGPDGEPFEIQIRTIAMHRTAEYGIAAHWRYKEGGRTDEFDAKLSWLRQMLDWQQEQRDPKEFLESLRTDLFSDQVFVFTPRGDVIDLSAGATPIDFAYRIHTDIGHRCAGAKVNGNMVPLTYRLRNGDIVEILTNKQGRPSWDWLALVRTSNARNRIRQWFKKERREEYVAAGRDSLEREVRRMGQDWVQLFKDDWVDQVVRRYNCGTEAELFLAVGCGAVSAGQVVRRLQDLQRQKQDRAVQEQELVRPRVDAESRRSSPATTDGVRVRGIDNVLVRFGRCCNPIPGDPIIGYITRGRGVSIHRIDCPNMAQYSQDRERLIEVSWDRVDAASYPVAIVVVAGDRPGLLLDIAAVVADTDANILSARARTETGGGRAVIDLVLEIRNTEQLDYTTNRIRRVRGVTEVRRVVREQTQ